jgi:hypothetical protein
MRLGLRVGNVWLTFSDANSTIKYYYTPGFNQVVIKGQAWGRIHDGVCLNGTAPDELAPQYYELYIRMTTGLQPVYGAPGDDVSFMVTEKAIAPPNQRVPIYQSEINTGYFYPVGHSDWNVSFGLAEMDEMFDLIPEFFGIVTDYSPVQFLVATSLPSTYTGTFTGAGAFRVTCPLGGYPGPSVRAALYNFACAPFFPTALSGDQGVGMFMFDIEAVCNDCAPTPTPGVCPIHGISHSHSRSQSQSLLPFETQSHAHISRGPSNSQSADLQSLSPNPISPTPFPPLFREFNQSCYEGDMFTKCGLMNSAVFAPDIWLDPAVIYTHIPFPQNSPFADFDMQLIEFNHTIVRSGQRFVKFWVPNMPGRTSVYLTVYLWSSVLTEPVNSSDSSGSVDDGSTWDESEEGEYEIPPNLLVLVGAGDSARFSCDRVADIAKCNVPFPAYGGYLYIGVATSPRYVLPFDLGFVYVEMLMINGLGFDDTFSMEPVIGPPNCVMLNVSVGTPHDPACNLAWDSAMPALGSNAYTETLASSTVGLFVMGGLGASALAFNLFGVDTVSTVLGVLTMGALNLVTMFFSGTLAAVFACIIIVGSFAAMAGLFYMKRRKALLALKEADMPISLNPYADRMPPDAFIQRDEDGNMIRGSMEAASLHAPSEDGDDIAALYTDEFATKPLVGAKEVIIENDDIFDDTGALPIIEKQKVYQKDLDE